MTLSADAETIDHARTLKRSLSERLFGVAAESAGSYLSAIPLDSNIQGFGFGTKMTGSSIGSEVAVRVYVRAKLAKASLSSEERIPDEIDGVPTDVIAVGDITPLWPRPVSCGVSIGHFAITAGTLGCLVENGAGTRYILSNNHVLANVNAGAPGDDILEPGPSDGGASHPPIARLTDFEPIDLTGAANRIDAAIAEPVDAGSVKPDILSIGRVTPQSIQPVQHMSVVKHGRTTQYTAGLISDVAADIRVRYGSKIGVFEAQIAVTGVAGPFSDGGDSGSLVVDAVGKRPVGLLFAGGGSTTFCNPIDLVMARFHVTIV